MPNLAENFKELDEAGRKQAEAEFCARIPSDLLSCYNVSGVDAMHIIRQRDEAYIRCAKNGIDVPMITKDGAIYG